MVYTNGYLTMKNTLQICQECHLRRAHGVWRIHNRSGVVDALFMCSQCGLRDYVARRETFTPSIRTELVASITTTFTPPKPTPDFTYVNGLTATQMARVIANRHPTKNVVPQSIRDLYK